MASEETSANPVPPELQGPTLQQVQDELYRRRVAEARSMSAEEKLLAGEELFEYACSITLAGIRHQHPGASEDECLQILRDRLQLRARLEACSRRREEAEKSPSDKSQLEARS